MSLLALEQELPAAIRLTPRPSGWIGCAWFRRRTSRHRVA